MAPGPTAPGSLYGRRKGKALRAGQGDRLERLLPRLRIAPGTCPIQPAALFSRSPRQVWMEIGFGGGEHLAHRAREHPEVGFIGVEPFVNGTVKLLAAVEQGELSNVRLWDNDAARLLHLLTPASLDRVYLLYPDPWPKRRQRKRRFLSDGNLASLARVMRPGAELCFATDIDDYAGWALSRILRSADFQWTATRPIHWREPWIGWPGTRYEAKARREGRTSAYLTFRRA